MFLHIFPVPTTIRPYDQPYNIWHIDAREKHVQAGGRRAATTGRRAVITFGRIKSAERGTPRVMATVGDGAVRRSGDEEAAAEAGREEAEEAGRDGEAGDGWLLDCRTNRDHANV